jgi:hypothetical protein
VQLLARRLITIAALLSLLLCFVSSTLFGFTVFFQDISRPFVARGALWEIACRGGVLFIDNEPQRDSETEQITAANFRARAKWEETHDSLRFAMEKAPYGPEYTAARLKMDAWEKENGIRWSGGPPAVAATAASEIHVHLALLVVVFAILPAVWVSIQGPASRRRLLLAGQFAVILLSATILVVLWRSYQAPIAFYLCTPTSSYQALIARGKISIGLPPVADPQKLAAVTKLAAHLRNEDLQWTVVPDIYFQHSGQAGYSRPPGLSITAEPRPGSVIDILATHPDRPEMLRACLRALHDPARFEAAHVILSKDRFFGRQQLAPGMTLGPMYWANSKVNNLDVVIAVEQRNIERPTKFEPSIVPNQLGKIELQWHKAHDRYTRQLPLWPAILLLLIFPVRWLEHALRQRRRRKQNACLTCGYNLTGNTTGICPECGTGIANPPVAVHA